ncbi:MAG TPA: hypothetical protein VHW74_18690 [Mycobacteriales bacterium]|jgi:hypothetical protein|nr:hypothetical protein [Mycobacteriales bacterium]
MQRCCPQHRDWSTLADHLLDDFSAELPERVLRCLIDARVLTDRMGLESTDALETAELMTRHSLMLSTGMLVDSARTDPQTHRTSSEVVEHELV